MFWRIKYKEGKIEGVIKADNVRIVDGFFFFYDGDASTIRSKEIWLIASCDSIVTISQEK